MYFVYILRSLRTGEYYKGLTSNLGVRLAQHDGGKVTFTKNKLPVVLVHVEIVDIISDARKMEIFFKSGFGREIIKEIDTMPRW